MNNKKQKQDFTTLSGYPIKPLYVSEDIPNFSDKDELGKPGDFPYTRGVYDTMYRGRLWTMRLFAGFGTSEETNQRYKFLLNQGQTGLSVALDMPTIMGYDSDHPKAAGEVGKCGVAVCTLDDMMTLFDEIPLNKITTSMTINAPASVLLAFYITAAKQQGVKLTEIGGTIQNDILKEYMAQNSWIFPPAPSLRLITDIFDFCYREVPKWNTISISGYHIREAGATAAQELAFTLLNGLTYVKTGIDAGLDVDSFAPRLSFFFDSHIDFFEEIAKFRAARKIWAQEMKKRFNPSNPQSLKLRFHTQTAGCSLTAEEPENNIIRTAYEALSAVFGGTQSLHTNSLDEVLALPSEQAALIALRTQQIIAYETEVINTIDPLAGSYFVENLTNKMEEQFYEYDEKVKKMGGVLKALENAFFQREIANAAFKYQQAIEKKKKFQVGVNIFRTKEKPKIEILKINPEIEEKQVNRVQNFKKKRNASKVQNALQTLQKAAKSKENLMPIIINTVESYATLGEITNTLKEVFGTFDEVKFI